MRADRVMEAYDEHATVFAGAQYPAWLYAAVAISGVTPAVKARPEEPDAVPDVRPIAGLERELVAITHVLTEEVREDIEAVLAPQQVACGMSGGISSVIHGARTLLELRKGFVAVKLDMTHGYGSIWRAASLRRLAQQPRLAHLVPLLHALGASPSDVRVGRLRQRLFAQVAERAQHGDMSEGWWQGLSLASLVFCVAIHPEVVALDAELAEYGGAARFIMDDGLAIGPPQIVFAAIERFARRLRASLGLVMKPSAYGCYSMGHDLTVCPFRGDIPIGVLDGEMVTDGEYLGIVVGGAPIGTDGFMGETMRAKGREVVSCIEHTIQKLQPPPFYAWSVLYSHCASLFDYCCRHVPCGAARGSTALGPTGCGTSRGAHGGRSLRSGCRISSPSHPTSRRMRRRGCSPRERLARCRVSPR